MEHTAEEKPIVSDEAWIADRAEVTKCPSFDLHALMDRVIERWKSAQIEYATVAKSMLGGPVGRANARSLREAEQTLYAVMLAAFGLLQDGFAVPRLAELMGADFHCRVLTLLPIANRIAERDGVKSMAEDIAEALAGSVQFIDGRAVITEAVAGQFPSPYAAGVAEP